jgi:hypothetical protein
MWDKTVHDFGETKAKTKVKATFKYLGELTIKEIKVACGCTTSNYNKGSNEITLEYTTTTIPKHLEKLGQKTMEVAKTATVTFDDNSTQVLFIKGVIKK